MTTDQTMPPTSISRQGHDMVARHARGRREDRERAEGADHEDLAVGEVDELDDAVDHRVAERDQRVDRTEHEAVGQLLEELRHRVTDWATTNRASVTAGRDSGEGRASPAPLRCAFVLCQVSC